MSVLPGSRSYPRRSVAVMLVVGVLAGLTVGGGVGVIAASTKTVTVCANKTTNMLRYAKSGTCLSTETIVVLNQTGATAVITQQSVCDGTDAGTVANELCKIGMTGPGGGHVFFVDYNDQYPVFDYLEAAPVACQAGRTWSSGNFTVHTPRGWAAFAVGQGQANTTAILAAYPSDGSAINAARYAASLSCGTQTDWFLGSLGEMMLMYTNLRQAGVGDFWAGSHWSSSEYSQERAWVQVFDDGDQDNQRKALDYMVRPVRAF